MEAFTGTGRRFEKKGEYNGATVIDDYAHHPTEIRATLSAARAVAKDRSTQSFNSILDGKNKCYGRTECDAIIVGEGKVQAKPEVNALHPDASLVHEASVGKLSGEQVTKLLTLGLCEKEAEERLLKGFLE